MKRKPKVNDLEVLSRKNARFTQRELEAMAKSLVDRGLASVGILEVKIAGEKKKNLMKPLERTRHGFH